MGEPQPLEQRRPLALQPLELQQLQLLEPQPLEQRRQLALQPLELQQPQLLEPQPLEQRRPLALQPLQLQQPQLQPPQQPLQQPLLLPNSLYARIKGEQSSDIESILQHGTSVTLKAHIVEGSNR